MYKINNYKNSIEKTSFTYYIHNVTLIKNHNMFLKYYKDQNLC